MNNLDIYLRVSTDSQIEDGFGIQNQKDLGIKVSEKLGMKPIIHNEGSKSSNSDLIEERPILNELMFKINSGEVKHLWVFNNDRLSRNENVWNTIRLTLRKNGCTLYVGEGTKYNLESSMDDFIFGIMSEVSKYDNRIRTDRLRRGKLSKIKSGGWRGGPTPFGYENRDGILVENKKESKWVRYIYDEYQKGTTIYGISKGLMKNGVVSRRGNIIWTQQSIRKILENTHYEGFHFYTDKKLNETVKCECPKVLPSTLVNKVRSKLDKETFKGGVVKYESLLRDFLVCGHCGSKYGQRVNLNPKQPKKHYFCRGNSERFRTKGFVNKVCKGDNGSRVRSLFIDSCDDLVWENVITIIEKSNLFKEIFKKEVMKDQKSFGKSMYEIKGYQRRIKQNERKIKDINDVMLSNKVDGLLTDSDSKQFKEVIKKFEEKKRELISVNEQLKDEIFNNKKTTKWVNWIDDFKNKIDDLRTIETFVEKKKFLDGVINKIIVKTIDKQNHSLDIEFVSPYVNDKLVWNEKGKPKKGYKVIDGLKNYITNYTQLDGPKLGTKKNITKRVGLN
ncbi:recombinase family protein [Alphaproteobacteria bacterium]|nr:recombinase family protein [Alphaproteobacteria bacterium]